jgi:hypothetical protein
MQPLASMYTLMATTASREVPARSIVIDVPGASSRVTLRQRPSLRSPTSRCAEPTQSPTGLAFFSCGVRVR